MQQLLAGKRITRRLRETVGIEHEHSRVAEALRDRTVFLAYGAQADRQPLRMQFPERAVGAARDRVRMAGVGVCDRIARRVNDGDKCRGDGPGIAAQQNAFGGVENFARGFVHTLR